MDKRKVTVLLVESDTEVSNRINGMLSEAKVPEFDCVGVEKLSAGLKQLKEDGADVVLLDLSLKDSKGIDTFIKLHDSAPDVPFVVITGPKDKIMGLKAVKKGAQDHIIMEELNKGTMVRSILYAIEIKNREIVEKELEQIEKRFKDIAENAQEWIWEVDTDGRFTYTSPVVKEILGYEREEVLGKHFYDLFCPEDRDELKELAFKMFKKKEPFRRFVYRNVHKDGSVVWLSTSGVPILDKKGRLLGYRGADSDITEFKKVEAGLRDSEGKLRSLLYSMDDLVFVIQRDGTFLNYYPTSANDDLYVEPNEFIGKNFREVLPSHTSRLLEAILKEIQKTCETQQFDYPLEIRGKKKWFHAKISPIFDLENNLSEFIGVVRNITDRKNSMKALKQSEKRFHDIAMSSADWIWEVDRNGRYTYVSGKVKEILGYNPDELLGKTPFELMPKEEAERVQGEFSRIASEKEPIVDLENLNLTRDGKRVCLLTNGVPIIDDEGELIGYRGVDKALNERKGK